MGRIAAERAALGGDGAVAVRLTIAPFQGSADHLETADSPALRGLVTGG